MSVDPIKVLVARSDGVVVSEFVLGDGAYLIGSSATCQLHVATASPEHARLEVTGMEMSIEDLRAAGSEGVFLDGAAVLGKLRVYSGQTLQVAERWFQVQAPAAGNADKDDLLAGRYRLVRTLGRGGRGEVWLAQDEELNETIAIKRLPAELTGDATALNDLMREVSKSRHLNHPNIIRTFDLVHPEGDPPFVTLEYVNGQDLADLRLKQPGHLFRWENLRPLMTQLCDALEYAHRNRIVHRDLKPANMLVDTEGNLKLADFGIAASMAESLSRSSMQGSVSGTSVYMSPQQMRGEMPRASDDLYALGSTFYELLTSRTPFYTGDIAHQVLNEDPKPLSERLRELGQYNQVPDAVCAMIMACLAKDPARRPLSAIAVEEWISGAATVVTSASGGLPVVPETMGKVASTAPPPAVPTAAPVPPPLAETPPIESHVTVQERIANTQWATIRKKDNPWHKAMNYLGAGFMILLLLRGEGALQGRLFCSVIVLVILAVIGKFVIKSERFLCSECDQKLKNDRPGPCPNCGASLT